jgi:hypothetical protein
MGNEASFSVGWLTHTDGISDGPDVEPEYPQHVRSFRDVAEVSIPDVDAREALDFVNLLHDAPG